MSVVPLLDVLGTTALITNDEGSRISQPGRSYRQSPGGPGMNVGSPTGAGPVHTSSRPHERSADANLPRAPVTMPEVADSRSDALTRSRSRMRPDGDRAATSHGGDGSGYGTGCSRVDAGTVVITTALTRRVTATDVPLFMASTAPREPRLGDRKLGRRSLRARRLDAGGASRHGDPDHDRSYTSPSSHPTTPRLSQG